MAYVMEEAAKRKIKVVVLDRPNPINGFDDRGPAARQGVCSGFVGVLPDAGPPRHDDGRAGAPVQRREQDRGGPDRRADEELDARAVVRRDRRSVGEPVAEHAEPERGDALPGHLPHRRTRTCRSAAAPTRPSSRSARRGSTAAAGRGPERAPPARRPVLSDVRSRRRSSRFKGEVVQRRVLVVTDRSDALECASRLGVEIAAAHRRG